MAVDHIVVEEFFGDEHITQGFGQALYAELLGVDSAIGAVFTILVQGAVFAVLFLDMETEGFDLALVRAYVADGFAVEAFPVAGTELCFELFEGT